MSTCHTPPPNRKMMIQRVGHQLAQRHGKQRTYTQPQIQESALAAGYAMDIHCWAYCVFMAMPDFNHFHQSIGESCDFSEMRATMFEGLNLDGFSLSDISLPDFELGSIFDLGSLFDHS
ncbi:MAG: hypothetical protein ABL949_01370 [Fimbriimonadaceae bacterium]